MSLNVFLDCKVGVGLDSPAMIERRDAPEAFSQRVFHSHVNEGLFASDWHLVHFDNTVDNTAQVLFYG